MFTYAPDQSDLREHMRAQATAAELWRRLRCGTFVPGVSGHTVCTRVGSVSCSCDGWPWRGWPGPGRATPGGWPAIAGRSGLWFVAACSGRGAGDPGGDGQHRAGVLAGEPMQDVPAPGAEFEAGQRAGGDLGLFGVWHEPSGGGFDGPVRHLRRLGRPAPATAALAGGPPGARPPASAGARYLRTVLRSSPRLPAISLLLLPAYQCARSPPHRPRRTFSLPSAPVPLTRGSILPSRWPGSPRHARPPHGE